MAKVETKTATAVELELPPIGGNISIALDDDAHYLRVTLDKSENFKVAAGEKLRNLLANQFNGNRNALRDWYEDNVTQGKAHRAWETVEKYLGVVIKHGDGAAEIFAKRDEHKRNWDREYSARRRQAAGASESVAPGNPNKINTSARIHKSEYDLRQEWLSDINVQWFKGEQEWQDRWLKDRGLSRLRGI